MVVATFVLQYRFEQLALVEVAKWLCTNHQLSQPTISNKASMISIATLLQGMLLDGAT